LLSSKSARAQRVPSTSDMMAGQGEPAFMAPEPTAGVSVADAACGAPQWGHVLADW
jgi:hypothetical protein